MKDSLGNFYFNKQKAREKKGKKFSLAYYY